MSVLVVVCCVCKYMTGSQSGCWWSLNLTDCTGQSHNSEQVGVLCHYYVTTMSPTNTNEINLHLFVIILSGEAKRVIKIFSNLHF